MKCFLISVFVFLTVDNSDASYKPLILPQLPVGEFRLKFLGMMNCASNNNMKFNWYLSKTSANTTELKGNITNIVPWDDSLDYELNMAIKDSIGGWKDNAFVLKFRKACSSIKNMLANAWTPIMNGFGIYNATCPIPAGVYISPGMNTEITKIDNFPKSFFYGTYKTQSKYTKNNVVHGCTIMVIQVRRPWETD